MSQRSSEWAHDEGEVLAVFLELCGRYQVPVIQYEPGELEQEMELLQILFQAFLVGFLIRKLFIKRQIRLVRELM